MIKDTSLEAFRRVSPKIGKSQAKVLDVIRAHPEGLTDAEINHYLQWTINRITPRRNELQKIGLIYDAGRRECRKTHSQAHAYKIVARSFPGEVKPLPPARVPEQEKLKLPLFQ